MRTEGCEAQTLRALASMPFLDRTEMVAVTGWSKAAVHEAVDQPDSGGFCAAVPHATALFPSSTQRFHLTAAGLGRLAEEEESSLDELVRDRPVSAQWRRNLMGRLDSLAAIYRLAAAVSGVAYPIRFRWYRASTLDASVELPSVLDRIEKGSLLPEEDEPRMVSVPADLSVEGPGWKVPDYLLPATLKPAEKRALDLISDWPWITLTDLAGMLAVSVPRASQLVTPLEGFRLVTRPIAGSGRMALTDRALALLARRDRTSVAVAKKRWSAAPLFPGTPFVWDNVTGARSRQLLRNVEHTAAVHAFLAALTVQAGLLDWEVSQVDPPRRASRHFKHGDGMRSVNPDAFGVLRNGETTWPFLLEWERRAVRPSTMSERLAPYLRYFSSHRPTDDHGTRPSVLIVFDDEIVQTHFLRLARDEMQAKGVAVPLWVSHRAAIEQMGPLGRAWRAPGDWQSPQAMPPQ